MRSFWHSRLSWPVLKQLPYNSHMEEPDGAPNIRNIALTARRLIDRCANEITDTVIEAGAWDGTAGTANELEQTILALLLAGLKARAERRSIAWAQVEQDAAVAMNAFADLPAVDTVQ